MERLFKPMQLQDYAKVPDGMGGHTESWATVANFNGVIDYLSGKEKEIALQVMADSTHILITKKADINRKQQVIFKGGVYRVLDVDNPMNMNRHYEILLQYTGVDQQ
jgi:SPP1 family predicted phage head-tail adaptor